ncbi:MAG: TerB family tellurite resistance protein [Halopseudomonas sp.]
MISRISQFFSNHLSLALDAELPNSDHALQLATAALLIEVSRADFNIDESERNTVVELLKKQFQLSTEELETLVTLAKQEAEQASSLYQFTRLINDHYNPQQKSQLIRNLWQIALADDYLDKHEDHLIRKVADLIHVPHSEFIRTKLAVIDSGNG